MNAEALNEVRQALSGSYSREIDRIIRGEVTDKARADNLKRIMDGLPVVHDDDQAVVRAALKSYRNGFRQEEAADELTQLRDQGKISGEAYDAAMCDLIDAHDCSDHIVGDGYCSQCGAIVRGTEADYREHGYDPEEFKGGKNG